MEDISPESEADRNARWGREILANLRLKDERGFLIWARPIEMRAALYAALEALWDMEAERAAATEREAFAMAKHFHDELKTRNADGSLRAGGWNHDL